MSYNVKTTKYFEKRFKILFKKYPSLKEDLIQIVKQLQLNPELGTPLGKNCFKIRINVKSKSKGKSGGARLITLAHYKENKVYLITIYDKSVEEIISESKLLELINEIRF